jgi:hypothetical protein
MLRLGCLLLVLFAALPRTVCGAAPNEDSAYAIIRKAIEQRAFHIKQIQDFQSHFYLKGVLRLRESPNKIAGWNVDKSMLGLDSSGKEILYLCEVVADYHGRKPNEEYTVIHSLRESGDAYGYGYESLPPLISFYANTVTLLKNSRELISPIAEDALKFYKYQLISSSKEGPNTIYKIEVIPKRAFEPLCFGYIYIIDSSWAIHSLSLSTNTRYGLDHLDTMRIEQHFLQLKKDEWIIKSQQLHPTISLFGFKVAGSFVTVYNDQKVNEPLPDSFFNKRLISTYDKTAYSKDSNYWLEARPWPLEEDEARKYVHSDSMLWVTEDPRYIDSVRRRDNRVSALDVVWNGVEFNDRGYRNSIRLSPLLFSVNFNSVEGFNVAPQITLTQKLNAGNSLTLNSAFRYGFVNTHFNAIGALTYTHENLSWRSRGWSLTAEGGKYLFQYDRNNPVTTFFNTFTTLLFSYNELKIYERWNSAFYFKQNLGNGIRWWARAAYEHRIPLENTTDFVFGDIDSAEYTSNLPATLRTWRYEEHDAVVTRIGISWQPGYMYVQYPNYKEPVNTGAWPTFTLQYEKGFPDIFGSDVRWDKWYAGMSGGIDLRHAGTLDYSLSASGIFNKRDNKSIGIPDLIHPFAGDDPAFTLASQYLRAFQLAPFYQYSNNNDFYSEVHIEYNLRGLLTNRIPGLREAKCYLILGTNTFYSRPDFYFVEAFASIDNIGYKVFRYFRLDFLHAWDGVGQTYNGIRVGIKYPALQRRWTGTGGLEWL